MKTPTARAVALGAAIVAAIAGFAWIIATQGPLAPIRVTQAQARETTLDQAVFGIGSIEARRSYNVGPTAAGRVARVMVDVGDRVAAGQLLAEMDPVDLDQRLLAGQAAAERAGHSARAAAAGVVEAASRARIAQASAERFAELQRQNFVSPEAADAKRHEANAAQAAGAAAKATLAAAEDEARRAAADHAGTGKTRAHLRLLSPIAGVVAARLGEPGSTLVGGQALLQVVDPASLWLRARIDQGRSGRLAVGLAAEVVLRSRPGQVLHGRLERLDLVGDAVAEERIANIAFTPPAPDLSIGELAEVTLRLPPITAAVAIPAAAIKRLGKTEGVWQLVEGRTVFRPLTTGASTLDGLVQVVSGLKAGETVIVHSSQNLAAQMRVKVVDSLVRGAP